MKIAYLGFDLMYPAMEALSQSDEIIKLFSNKVDGVYEKNDKAIALAKRLSIPYTLEKITKEDIDELIKDGCEMMISAGYYHRIPTDDRLIQLNIHPSLLPYGRGAWPMPKAILDRLPRSGVTVHKLEESFDTGDIVLQKSFELSNDETLESFMDKVNSLLPDMMRELSLDCEKLCKNARPQGYGEYQKEPDPADCALSPESEFTQADPVLRAFYGFPVPYIKDGRTFELCRARAVARENENALFPIKGGYIEESV